MSNRQPPKPESWDTAEVSLIIMNDEFLYYETEDVTHHETMKEIVQPYITAEHGRQYINFSNVDWWQVVNVRNDED